MLTDEGPTRRPRAERWPLDGVLVGVGTLRVLRHLFRDVDLFPTGEVRAWDAALHAGVTPQGAAAALERLARAGLVVRLPVWSRTNGQVYRLDPRHPLVDPLRELFAIESQTVRAREREARAARAARRRSSAGGRPMRAPRIGT